MKKTITRKNGRTYTTKDNTLRFLYPEEYLKIESALSGRTLITVQVLLHTGARINEARHVKVEDIDLHNHRITLKITKTKAKKGESHGRTRILPISEKLTKLLKRHIKRYKLLPQDYLGLVSTPRVKQALQTAGESLGLKEPGDLSAHTLRKTLEVWLMALDVGDLKLLAHFGHDIRTAARHYISPDVLNYNERLEVRRILGDLYARRMY